MLDHLDTLKEILIKEFYQLYDQYNDDGIYACSLVFDEFLRLDDLAISTERSIFNDQEDRAQYLSESDRWNAAKWRYRTTYSSNSGMTQFRALLDTYFKNQHSFGNPLLEHGKTDQANTLDVLLKLFKQARDALEQDYGLDLSQILFFIHMPPQPQMELQSATYLNPDSALRQQFLSSKQSKNHATAPRQFKLSQSDKDLLIDLAQLVRLEAYDYLNVAHQAYLLTLEPHFVDANLYIQKLIQHIAAMATEIDGSCAMTQAEIQERISQFER
ncbi:hypothetical protein BS636_02475 [Acinetobacter sp. LoGeW2-3]|uniref:DUF4303 domain-containing protein n=1 Tax=Acinetobacter sp. LoGeW2-3 TaxID=1808001 RepID=UPI000C05B8F0|nr:DUF4303 domain-containing protein [Acinetobacter sp. LoGeW2-3]ATO18606.1 hypothetical protein BS636_02475 [Acinetobacter sp. LoGeW2-3]